MAGFRLAITVVTVVELVPLADEVTYERRCVAKEAFEGARISRLGAGNQAFDVRDVAWILVHACLQK